MIIIFPPTVAAPRLIPSLRFRFEVFARGAVVAPLMIPDVCEEEEPLTGRATPLAPPSPRDAVGEAAARAAVVVPLKIPDPFPGDWTRIVAPERKADEADCGVEAI